MNKLLFSLDDFKKWIQQQNAFSTVIKRTYYIGTTVESDIPKKKLASRMCVREGNLGELAEDFAKKGGVVIDIDGKHLVVEVDSGSFSLPECCVRR